MARMLWVGIGVVLTGALLSACASVPQKTLGALSMSDPLYDSPGCLQARNLALQYDDKTLGRAGLGLGLGLLGPVGLVGAVAIDANQNEKRKYFNEEIRRRCRTPGFVPAGGDPAALSDKRTCVTNSEGKIQCT